MTSLAEQISNLANPTPISEDPEDITDDTGAKLISARSAEDEEDSLVTSRPSRLRSRSAPLLSQEDPKYAGRRTSRKQLHDTGAPSDDDILSGDSDDDDDNEGATESDDVISSAADDADSDDVIQSDDEIEQLAGFKEKMKFQQSSSDAEKTFSFEDNGDYEKYGDGTSDDDSEEDSEESDEEDEEESDAEEDESVKGGVQQFSKVDVEDEIKKGKAVKCQLNIWDSMLEARIKMQKALIVANQLPQPEQWQNFVDGGETEYQKSLQEAQGFLQKLLEQLVSLQSLLLLQNPETRPTVGEVKDKTSKKEKKPSAADDDEEITSDSDEDSEAEAMEMEQTRKLLKRKMKKDEYPEFIAKRHKEFVPYRNTTIQKWFDKTRVASGKLNKGFSAFEQSALKQIERTMSDRERLIKRTQLKRSTYNILGKPEQQKTQEATPDDDVDITQLPSRDHLKEYDEEIFDDDDFYHQLLRELIEKKTSDINDPIALSRQWLEIQKLRGKTKKNVDTKASKGRKIRYNIHPKLVNFMAPLDSCAWTDEARDELYKSLFGKRATSANTAEKS